MRVLDISFDSPAENLALDEVLLNRAEEGRAPSTLRLWESPVLFVVIGTAQSLSKEVHEEHCRTDGVPVLRRCTAGGCVLQGPGSFNYALALRYEDYPETKGIHASYAFILGRLAAALAERGIRAECQGSSDLAIEGGLKVSGNAQRRRRNAFLHHGSLLYRPDYGGMERYLREPEERPDYREDRGHRDFVGSLPLDSTGLRGAVRDAFAPQQAADALGDEDRDEMRILARQKYLDPNWTCRRP